MRYPSLAALLALALSGVLAGARSFAAIGQWSDELPGQGLERLGLAVSPDESTLRKLFARLDAAALDTALAVFAWSRTRLVAGRRVIAIDGKTVRGARSATTDAPHLLCAVDTGTGVVLGQLAVGEKTNEIPAVRDLLAGFDPADLKGAVITLDAMHTQNETATAILELGAQYVFTVKANRPRLLAELKDLPWSKVGGHASTDRNRGRRITRTIKVLQKPEWISFPGAVQVAQVRRTRIVKNKTGKPAKTVELVYLITSADATSAQPATLADWIQSHWTIENRVHYVRDVTYGEDHSRVRTGAAPHVMAALRNTAIAILRLNGWDNIAAANRHHAHHPEQAITCLLAS
jgi:predicted transposase YbfD/YdcC